MKGSFKAWLKVPMVSLPCLDDEVSEVIDQAEVNKYLILCPRPWHNALKWARFGDDERTRRSRRSGDTLVFAAKHYIDDNGCARGGGVKLVRDPGMLPDDRICGIRGPFGFYKIAHLLEGGDVADPIHLINVDSLIAALASAFWFNGGGFPNPHVSLLKALMTKLDRTDFNRFLPAHAGVSSVPSVFRLLGPGEALTRMPAVEKKTAKQLGHKTNKLKSLAF
jgi:hypothetical protein